LTELGPEAHRVVAELAREHALGAWGYADPRVHRVLLQDTVRTEAFRAAIEEVVREGDVVIDVGAGSGILSLFAARAGASAVHALESSAIVDLARRVAAENGCPQIVFHPGDAARVDLGQVQADVIVSEWLGTFATAEALFPAVAAVRDRALKPGGAMIPARVELFLAPVSDPDLAQEGPHYWHTRPYDFDLSLFDAGPASSTARSIPRGSVLCEPARVHSIDCSPAGPDDLAFDSRVGFALERDAELNGFCGYFTATLSPSVTLDTGPHAPPTHWRQRWFPIPPLALRAGDLLEVRFSASAAARPRYELLVLAGGQRVEARFL